MLLGASLVRACATRPWAKLQLQGSPFGSSSASSSSPSFSRALGRKQDHKERNVEHWEMLQYLYFYRPTAFEPATRLCRSTARGQLERGGEERALRQTLQPCAFAGTSRRSTGMLLAVRHLLHLAVYFTFALFRALAGAAAPPLDGVDNARQQQLLPWPGGPLRPTNPLNKKSPNAEVGGARR